MLSGIVPTSPYDERDSEETYPREQVTCSQLHKPGGSGTLGTVHCHPIEKCDVTSTIASARLHNIWCSTKYVGVTVGETVGFAEGVALGNEEGIVVGIHEGAPDGSREGVPDGYAEG